MAARVIHFGWDNSFRVPVLRAAGFRVQETRSLDELSVDLQDDEDLGAVVISEDLEIPSENAAEVVRQCTLAPVILFRRTRQDIDGTRFDKVFDSSVAPWDWLGETAALIARCRALREYSDQLWAETAQVWEEFQRQQERARQLCKRPAKPPEHDE